MFGVHWGSGLATLVGGGPPAVAARHGREALAARAAGRPQLRDLERAAARRAWQGQRPSDEPRRASDNALGGGSRPDKSNRKRNE